MQTYTKVIDGTTYVGVPESRDGCSGCAAYVDNIGDRSLCAALGTECATEGIMWVKHVPTGFNGTCAADIPKTLGAKDQINPDHYKVGGIETIEYLKAKLSPEEFQGYLKGNALKYLSRSNYKHDNPIEDFKKALWYVNRLVQDS